MYDPSSVAHDIRLPWPGSRYGVHLCTIWHEDPETPGRGGRTNDSCGWFHPPTTKEERERIRKLGESEWSTIFSRRAAEAEGKSYAYVCTEPTTYDAIYWTWRRIKYLGRKGWNFGERKPALSVRELEAIYTLATNPVDNLELTVRQVNNAEACGGFFLSVYSAYKRFYRPWWQHPRWHVHHWRFQFPLLQDLNRWLFARCDKCGGRFRWREGVMGSWGGDAIWHMDCESSGYGPAREMGSRAAQCAAATTVGPKSPSLPDGRAG